MEGSRWNIVGLSMNAFDHRNSRRVLRSMSGILPCLVLFVSNILKARVHTYYDESFDKNSLGLFGETSTHVQLDLLTRVSASLFETN